MSPAGKITPRSELYESLSRLPRPSGSDVGGAPATGSYSNLESEDIMRRRPRHICNRPGVDKFSWSCLLNFSNCGLNQDLALKPADQAHFKVAISPTDQFFELSKLREYSQTTPKNERKMRKNGGRSQASTQRMCRWPRKLLLDQSSTSHSPGSPEPLGVM